MKSYTHELFTFSTSKTTKKIQNFDAEFSMVLDSKVFLSKEIIITQNVNGGRHQDSA